MIQYFYIYFKEILKEGDFLPLAGIVAEFNPFHNGHKYLIDYAKRDGCDVAVVISSNFVQRGDVAIIPKYKRALTAISNGADIVAELPVAWSMSTAQNFALGALSQLIALGINTLYFGSESADTVLLNKVADILISDEYQERIKQNLSTNETFAKIRRDIVCEILGFDTNLLDNPNDTLAVEYICAAKKLGASIKFKAVKRVGAQHNSIYEENDFSTATLLRKAVANKNIEYLRRYMPTSAVDILLSSPTANIEKIDSAIISSVKKLSPKELSILPDVGEGLHNLIYNSARECHSFSALCNMVKTKRYTHARIRRILLCAYLGIDNSFFLKEPPYVKILAVKEGASKYLKNNAEKQIIIRVSQLDLSNEFVKLVFVTENRSNELYALSLDKPDYFINECKEKLIKLK